MPWIVEGDGQRIPEHRGCFAESNLTLGQIPRRLVWVSFEFHSVSLPRRSGPGKPEDGNGLVTSAHQSGRPFGLGHWGEWKRFYEPLILDS